MTYVKLKPCPWCGRPTKLINYGELYFVTCDDAVNGWLNCNRVAVVYYQSVEDAIKGWNEEETENAIRIEDMMCKMTGRKLTKEEALRRAEARRRAKK